MSNTESITKTFKNKGSQNLLVDLYLIKCSDVPASTMFLRFLTAARYGNFFFSMRPSHTAALLPCRAI